MWKNDIGNHVLLKTYIYIDPYTKNIYLDTTNKSFEDCIEIFCLQNYGKLYDYYLNNSEIIEIEIDNPDVYTTYYQYETIK